MCVTHRNDMALNPNTTNQPTFCFELVLNKLTVVPDPDPILVVTVVDVEDVVDVVEVVCDNCVDDVVSETVVVVPEETVEAFVAPNE